MSTSEKSIQLLHTHTWLMYFPTVWIGSHHCQQCEEANTHVLCPFGHNRDSDFRKREETETNTKMMSVTASVNTKHKCSQKVGFNWSTVHHKKEQQLCLYKTQCLVCIQSDRSIRRKVSLQHRSFMELGNFFFSVFPAAMGWKYSFHQLNYWAVWTGQNFKKGLQ